jgi:hydrogenase nickel incorporation protein HypB
MPIEIVVMKAVNENNAQHAAAVRGMLDELNVVAVNLMSSPGSGKTSLLEATIARLAGQLSCAVIEGDVFTALDAERIARLNVPTAQLNTEGSCHLTAHMLERVIPELDLGGVDLLFIENIGNLICPASFDLGEHYRVACLSTAEGQDKVAKYPKLFGVTHANLITKTDLAPHVEFDLAAAHGALQRLNPHAPVFRTSVRTGEGLDEWCEWLCDAVLAVRGAGPFG